MTLDPVLLRLLEAVPLEVALPVDWPAQRAAAASMIPLVRGTEPLIEVSSVEDRSIDGSGGPVALRIYRPTTATEITLHYIHGGGWTLGDLETVDHTIRYFCEALPAVVVSSTYRLAPEHPFPAAFEDAVTAAEWVVDHVDELGGNAEYVAIAGDSAGGNLAAAAAISLRDKCLSSRHPLRAQLLLYPAVDLRPESWASPSRTADADPSLPCAAMRATVNAYISDADPSDWRLSPIAADDLSNLPPALVVVLSVDPVRDEGVAYAEHLRQAGSQAELLEFSHLTHGFAHLRLLVPAAAEALNQVTDRFREFLSAA